MANEMGKVMEKIVEYMDHFNRPFNANNLVDEFAKHAKKSVVIKALEELERTGAIQLKMFGKIKIYLSDQNKFPTTSEEELDKLLASLTEQTEKLEEVSAEASKASKHADLLAAEPSDADLASDLVARKERVKQMKVQLQECRAAAGGGGGGE